MKKIVVCAFLGLLAVAPAMSAGAVANLCFDGVDFSDLNNVSFSGTDWSASDDSGKNSISGVAMCVEGEFGGSLEIVTDTSGLVVGGNSCICKMISPVQSSFIYIEGVENCAEGCAKACVENLERGLVESMLGAIVI